MCTLGNRLYVQNNLSLEYRLYLATYAEFRTFAGLSPTLQGAAESPGKQLGP